MGTLGYGPNVHGEIDDRSLFHLDVLLTRLRGASFQLHIVGLSGARDGNLASLSITPGVPLFLEYLNSPELDLDMKVIERAMYKVHTGTFVSLPFAFDSDSGEVLD